MNLIGLDDWPGKMCKGKWWIIVGRTLQLRKREEKDIYEENIKSYFWNWEIYSND